MTFAGFSRTDCIDDHRLSLVFTHVPVFPPNNMAGSKQAFCLRAALGVLFFLTLKQLQRENICKTSSLNNGALAVKQG